MIEAIFDKNEEFTFLCCLPVDIHIDAPHQICVMQLAHLPQAWQHLVLQLFHIEECVEHLNGVMTD